LAGFRVYEERVTGSKDVRAEPWACQLASGNVCIVDNGEQAGHGKATWDVDGYVQEHVLFRPDMTTKRLGKQLDRVDGSSGGFNWLIKKVGQAVGSFRVLTGRLRQHKGLRLVACSRDQLAATVLEQPAVLVVLDDPSAAGERAAPDELPPHGLNRLLDHLTLRFADLAPAELQERWAEPLAPWGRLPEELVMSREHGKQLWRLLSKKRDPGPEAVVFCDRGDRRALSAAVAVAETLRLDKGAVYAVGDEEGAPPGPASNLHVADMVRLSRGLVI